jgi:hypothetical protein
MMDGRRMDGEGSIHQQQSGSRYFGFIAEADEDGKLKRRTFRTRTSTWSGTSSSVSWRSRNGSRLRLFFRWTRASR